MTDILMSDPEILWMLHRESVAVEITHKETGRVVAKTKASAPPFCFLVKYAKENHGG